MVEIVIGIALILLSVRQWLSENRSSQIFRKPPPAGTPPELLNLFAESRDDGLAIVFMMKAILVFVMLAGAGLAIHGFLSL
jgi:hypothetical protein